LSSRPSRTLQSEPELFDTRPKSREDAARCALDSLAGHTLTGAEWVVARSKLPEFVTILRGWVQKSKNGELGFGNVEVPCLREL
jgi:hypothetical protein